MVLAPIEPVAPKSDTVRIGLAACGTRRPGIHRRHGSPYHQAACRGVEPAAQQPDQRGRGRSRNEAVQPVHQAAVPGNQMAGVLDARTALERGFERDRRPVTTTDRPKATTALNGR